MTGQESRFIQRVRESLERLGIPDTVARLWWPRRKLFIRRRGRRLASLQPLFPGYVFLETDEIDEPLFREVRRCSGFVRFLKSNSDIQPLSQQDLDVIRHFLSFGEVIAESKVTFDENNRIKIKEGPLAGLEGRIVKVNRRKGRAKVQLDMYENSYLVDLGFEIMQPNETSAVS
jgi:transcriptional antiterminator NusG